MGVDVWAPSQSLKQSSSPSTSPLLLAALPLKYTHRAVGPSTRCGLTFTVLAHLLLCWETHSEAAFFPPVLPLLCGFILPKLLDVVWFVPSPHNPRSLIQLLAPHCQSRVAGAALLMGGPETRSPPPAACRCPWALPLTLLPSLAKGRLGFGVGREGGWVG